MISTQEETSWEIASDYVKIFVPVTSLFSAAIRAISTKEATARDATPEELKTFAIQTALFPIRITPQFKVALYYAALELERRTAESEDPLTTSRLLKLFSSQEITSIMALTYLYRTVRKRCDPEEWERLSKKICLHIRLGALTGEWIPQVGIGYGMLIGGLRFISQALFISRDLKGYKQFRRNLEKSGAPFNLKEEEERFGCNHLQISSTILGVFGFGMVARAGITAYLSQRPGHMAKEEVTALDADIRAWHRTLQCIEAFHSKNATEDEEASLGPLLAKLSPIAAPLIKNESGFNWIIRRKEELPAIIANSLDLIKNDEQESVAVETMGAQAEAMEE